MVERLSREKGKKSGGGPSETPSRLSIVAKLGCIEGNHLDVTFNESFPSLVLTNVFQGRIYPGSRRTRLNDPARMSAVSGQKA